MFKALKLYHLKLLTSLVLILAILFNFTACDDKSITTLDQRIPESELKQASTISVLPNTYYFGFDLRSSPQEDAKQYLPFLDYLSRKTGYIFKLRFTKKDSTIAEDLSSGKVDFAAIGAVSFLYASKNSKVKILVRGINKNNKDTYQSYIIVKAGSDIKKISQLRNKRIAFGNINSTQGHLIPRIILAQHNILLNDLDSYIYAGSHQNCAEAVLNDNVVACGMQDTLANQLHKEGLIEIIAQSVDYPSSGIAINDNISDEVQKKVLNALLEFKPQGKDSSGLYNWHKTEMPNGFVRASDSDYKHLKDWLIKLKLVNIK